MHNIKGGGGGEGCGERTTGMLISSPRKTHLAQDITNASDHHPTVTFATHILALGGPNHKLLIFKMPSAIWGKSLSLAAEHTLGMQVQSLACSTERFPNES